METILTGIAGVKVYQDDILIYAPRLSKLRNREYVVTSRLKAANVSMNEHKSIQRVENVDFLGFNISADGVRPSSSLVTSLQSLMHLQNQTELLHFIGLVNYY